MSGGYAKINGTQRKIVGAWSKVNGTWRKGSVVSAKVNGQWKEAWKNAFPSPTFLIYPNTIIRGDTFTWTTDSITGANYEIQSRYNGGSWSASTFSSTPTGSFTASSNTANTSIQLRVRAVAPGTHDKQSGWYEGPTRSLGADVLDKPTGLTYPTTLTRGQKITVRWNAKSDVKYHLQAVYNDGTPTATLYSGFGGGSADYYISTGTSNSKVKFQIKGGKSGYIDSPYTVGPQITLNPQKLATISSISAPKPYQGQTITVSWGAVTNATTYQLEVQYNNGSWIRAYTGSNRSYTAKVSSTATSIQWRVRPTAIGYADGDWKYSDQVSVALPPLKQTTWTATLVRSWRSKEDWGWRDPSDTGDTDSIDRMYQGSWNSPPWWGNHRGLAFFNYNSIKSTLAGKDIEKVRVYMYRINAGGYVSGQSIKLWTHNYASVPSGRPDLSYVQGPFSSFARGEGKWITVDNKVAERIRDGSAKGIALYREDELGYLFMSPNVKIEVTYR
ncbi:hypothetical protein [Priestia megaterium]|uniref:hypothetical protein n=1 Tax=Priestia megaterium TaxID=1404 RepID=UPI002E1E86C2|nr:hypothetical protein [Priestia megaterium]